MPLLRIHERSETTRCRRATWLGVVLAISLSSFNWLAVADDSKSKIAKPIAGSKSAVTKSTKSATSAKPADAKSQPGKSTSTKAAADKKAATVDAATALEPLSAEREAAAIQFAQQHHRELAELLNRLQSSYPDQYTKAIRELDKTRDRLDRARDKDGDRYAILLREWQLDSRVRLLAARMMMGGTPELENELMQLLTERHGVRLQLLTYDREKSKTRMQKFDEQIAEHVQNREATIDREFDRIKKSAETRKKTVTKPAAKRTGDKD